MVPNPSGRGAGASERQVALATARTAKQFILDKPGYLRVEISRDGQDEINEIYRSLAVLCVSRQVRRVLLVAQRDHSSGEHVLREAFSAMVLAGIPEDFRLAFVAGSREIAERYRQAISDLGLASLEAQIFYDETDALDWLTG